MKWAAAYDQFKRVVDAGLNDVVIAVRDREMMPSPEPATKKRKLSVESVSSDGFDVAGTSGEVGETRIVGSNRKPKLTVDAGPVDGNEKLQLLLAKSKFFKKKYEELKKIVGDRYVTQINWEADAFDWWKDPKKWPLVRPYQVGGTKGKMLPRPVDPDGVAEFLWSTSVATAVVTDWKYNNQLKGRLEDEAKKNPALKDDKTDLVNMGVSFRGEVTSDRALWSHGRHFHFLRIDETKFTKTKAYSQSCNPKRIKRKTRCLTVDGLFLYLLYMVDDRSHVYMGATGKPLWSWIGEMMKNGRGILRGLNLKIEVADIDEMLVIDDESDEDETSGLDFESVGAVTFAEADTQPAPFDLGEYNCESSGTSRNIEILFDAGASDKQRNGYRRNEAQALWLAHENVFSQKDLLCNPATRILSSVHDVTRARLLVLARMRAMDWGVAKRVKMFYDKLEEEEKCQGKAMFEKLEQDWRNLVVAIALRIGGKCEKKAMAVFASGPSNVGKSYVMKGLNWLRPFCPSLTMDENYRFCQLQEFNYYAMLDDAQCVFVNQKDAAFLIQVLGGQECEVHGKYVKHTPAFVTPIIVLNNSSGFTCMGCMNAGVCFI